MQVHYRAHVGVDSSRENVDSHSVENAVPSSCPLCSSHVGSWDQFYKCIMEHLTPIKPSYPTPQTSEDFGLSSRSGSDQRHGGSSHSFSFNSAPDSNPPEDLLFLSQEVFDQVSEQVPCRLTGKIEDNPEREDNQGSCRQVPLDDASEREPDQKDLPSDISMPPAKKRKLGTNKIDNSETKPAMKSENENKYNLAHSESQISSAESNDSELEPLSLESSMKTEITQPSQDGSDAAHSEPQQSEELDHLLNPAVYYEKLDELEALIAMKFNIDSGLRTHILTDPEIRETSKESSFALEDAKIGFLDALASTERAIGCLNSEGFCGSTFSILVKDQFRSQVAKTVHISLEDIDCSNITSPEHAIALFDKILGYEEDKQNGMKPPHHLIYNFLQNLLPLALVSFSGSHVCRFDINLWSEHHDEIPVGLDFSFQSQELACLKDFIGGPAWVLGKAGEQEVQTGLKVSLTVQDLQELWGPVWLVGGTADEGPIIRTERGFITPLPRDEQHSNFEESGEIDCHWTKDVPEYIDREERILLNGNSRILIGSDPWDAGGLAVNLNCESRINHIQQQISHQFQFPGTCNDCYRVDGHDIQLTGGQYVNAGVIIKRKRVPGKTHKDRLLSTCCNSKIDIRPLMKLRVGLEISACTGNAQRITLWDALRLSQTKEKTGKARACNHQISDPRCIELCWTKLDFSDTKPPDLHDISMKEKAAPRHNGFDSLIDKSPQENSFAKDEIRQAIVSSIQGLEYTGIDAEGNLQAYWPFLGTPTNRRIAPTRFNKWMDILTDTRDMSTFAVVSQRCLNFREGCTGLPWEICPQSYRDPIQKTCLALRVVPRPISERARPARRFKFGLSTPPDSSLTELGPGSAFRIGKRKLYVKKSWQGQQVMVAYTSSKFDISSKWTGVLDFHEQLDPEIKELETVDVIICSKEYGDS
ncbi:hypothetical protein N7481_011739 [Penicillium waksmanii]|uniref:uncharacterized protein n=1 Tax=Penicillium waksmanii TaxID=69791 RepID=UPI00254699F0|nr:uncharacterized protein N7481_011739 [Penicillium waksmanii]KAJ5974529.1 hypothetical protein N7481_011739 [Penicillium waksmanii]